MKKFIYNFCNAIYWFFYKFTPKGKRAFILKQGFSGLQESKAKGSLTKINIIGQAKKLLKPKKLLAFHKGNSISKSKKSNHQVIDQVKKTNKRVLDDRNLKITKKGKFVNA